MLGATLLLMLADAPATAKSVEGLYQSHQMEVGAALLLEPNMHFKYQLDYGAVSESAEGDWSFDGKAVHLTTKPTPKPPHFLLVRDDPAPLGELSISLEGEGWGRPLDALVFLEGKRPEHLDADETGRIDLTGKPRATGVQPLMPIYEPAYDPVTLSADCGHRLQFRFEPNDLGKAAFASEPLALDGTSLLMQRYGTMIRFNRQQR